MALIAPTSHRTMATISTISQPLRGEFIRTAATAGAVVYQWMPVYRR
jgi:hypothetical protein